MPDALKFSMDEHVPRAVTEGLRRRGVDVLTAREAGLLGADDEQHLATASSEWRVIVTQDADFLRLHASGAGPSIRLGVRYRRVTPPGHSWNARHWPAKASALGSHSGMSQTPFPDRMRSRHAVTSAIEGDGWTSLWCREEAWRWSHSSSRA